MLNVGRMPENAARTTIERIARFNRSRLIDECEKTTTEPHPPYGAPA